MGNRNSSKRREKWSADINFLKLAIRPQTQLGRAFAEGARAMDNLETASDHTDSSRTSRASSSCSCDCAALDRRDEYSKRHPELYVDGVGSVVVLNRELPADLFYCPECTTVTPDFKRRLHDDVRCGLAVFVTVGSGGEHLNRWRRGMGPVLEEIRFLPGVGVEYFRALEHFEEAKAMNV